MTTKRKRRSRHIDHLSFTSTHSVDPINPYSSAPHEQNMMVLRGFHSPRERWGTIPDKHSLTQIEYRVKTPLHRERQYRINTHLHG